MGYYFRTGAVEPRFPLLCHDTFTIEGYFKAVESLAELNNVLATEQLEITMWQNGRRLAYFQGNLNDILRTNAPTLKCGHTGNIEVLMNTTSAFPVREKYILKLK